MDSKNLKNLHIGLREVGAKRLLKGVRNTNNKNILISKAKFAKFLFCFCASILYHLLSKVVKSETTSFHYFPKGFQISKKLYKIGKLGQKTFKWYLKSEQMYKQTHTRTIQLIESIGPKGRCFENTRFKISSLILDFIDQDLFSEDFPLVGKMSVFVSRCGAGAVLHTALSLIK